MDTKTITTYYLHKNKEKTGPFTIKELEKIELNKDVFVWKEGFEDWKNILEVSELVFLIQTETVPPPFKNKEKNKILAYIKKAIYVSIAIVLILFIFQLIMSFYYNKINQPESIPSESAISPIIYAPKPQTYEEKIESVRQEESSNPSNFINVDFSFRTAIFGGNYKITGTLTSNATSVTYKDVTIRIKCHSQTDSFLGSKDYTIYQYLEAGKKIGFSDKFSLPSKTSKISISVISAQDARE